MGKTAREAAGFVPDAVVSLIKREIGNKDYSRAFYGREFSPSGISGIILAALAQSAEEETGRTVKQVVITVPAYFGPLEKDATRKAGEIAGLEVTAIIPEPVAAALAYGVADSADGTTFLVYDLGGATFDVTLMRMTSTSMEVLYVDGDHKLGGANWDARLYALMKDQSVEQTGDDSILDDEASLYELRRMAEDAKKALTRTESKKVNHRLVGGMATSIHLTRSQFEEITSDLLEATITITNRMLAKAEQRFPGIRAQIGELLLVGGSTKMPAVTERLQREYPWRLKLADPDLAVAKGAALYAASPVHIVEAAVGNGSIFGIDLGSTYSVIACLDEAGNPVVLRNTDGDDTTPSVVYFETADNTVVGKTAKDAAGFRPDEVVSLIKRKMGNKDYSRAFYGREFFPSGISGIILAALAQSAEEETGRTVKQVVITVPAFFGPLEKDATRKAGEIAGLEVTAIIPEPVAAVLAHRRAGSRHGATYLVYDLGGATFDVTLVRMTGTTAEVLTVDGARSLGGADWDAQLFEFLMDQTIEQAGDESICDDEASLHELLRLAEMAKQALTKAESKKVNHRLAGGMATSIRVTRTQFEEMTSDLLEATITITNRMLAKAEQRFPGIRAQISELLLVGGSTKMPAVAERVRREYPWEPQMADPDLAVAKGAALYTADLSLHIVNAVAGNDTSGDQQAMKFDKEAYKEFLSRHSKNRTDPVDLLERYAITLLPGLADAEVREHLKAVRAFWIQHANGNARISKMAKWCRDRDAELKSQHGNKLETAAWWKEAAAAEAQKAQAAIRRLIASLAEDYGKLGAVTAAGLAAYGSRQGLTYSQAVEAARQAGLFVVDEKVVLLPDQSPINSTQFKSLAWNLKQGLVKTIPELLHPGSGTFRIVSRYECVGNPALRLDAASIERQKVQAGKAITPANTAKGEALAKLSNASQSGVDLGVVALYHLMELVQDAPPAAAKRELTGLGVEATDAAIIAALLDGHQKATRVNRADQVRTLLADGQLREAETQASMLPDGDEKAEVSKLVTPRRKDLADLLAKAEEARQQSDEAQAERHLRHAAMISREDADDRLRQLPLAPPGRVTATGDGTSVKLFWERGAGHDESTIYAVARTAGRSPVAPQDGARVHWGTGTECADSGAPTATVVQYGVFATAEGRPPSRPAVVSVTSLPPVWG